MKTAYDPNMLFKVLIEQVQNGADYAAHAGSMYTAKQTLDIAYNLAFCAGVFDNDLCDWRRKPANTKSWATFQTFMAKRYNKWQQEHGNTAGQQYRTANTVHAEDPMFEQQTIDAIADLATATMSNCATVVLLTTTIHELTLELKNAQTKLVKALKSNAKLAALQANKENNWTGNNNRNARPGGRKGKPANRHYCWTHRFLCTHHSGECPDPKPDHIITAKSRNTQGGSQSNKDDWVKIAGQQ